MIGSMLAEASSFICMRINMKCNNNLSVPISCTCHYFAILSFAVLPGRTA